MVPNFGSSREESTTSEIGFCPGYVQERLTRGTQRTTVTRTVLFPYILRVRSKLDCKLLVVQVVSVMPIHTTDDDETYCRIESRRRCVLGFTRQVASASLPSQYLETTTAL